VITYPGESGWQVREGAAWLLVLQCDLKQQQQQIYEDTANDILELWQI